MVDLFFIGLIQELDSSPTQVAERSLVSPARPRYLSFTGGGSHLIHGKVGYSYFDRLLKRVFFFFFSLDFLLQSQGSPRLIE